MKLVPYNVEELKPKFYKKSDNYIFLMEFSAFNVKERYFLLN